MSEPNTNMPPARQQFTVNAPSRKTVGITILVIALALLALWYFTSVKGDNTNSGVVNSKDNGAPNIVVPENNGDGEFTGNTEGKGSTEENIYYGAAPAATGVFPNGDRGYNLNVTTAGVSDKIQGEYGVTRDGWYFHKTGPIDKCNNQKDPNPIRIGGVMTANGEGKWGFRKVEVKSVDGQEYYVYKADKPVADKNGNIKFCFWYKGTHFFYPHEGVKKGIVKVTSTDVI